MDGNPRKFFRPTKVRFMDKAILCCSPWASSNFCRAIWTSREVPVPILRRFSTIGEDFPGYLNQLPLTGGNLVQGVQLQVEFAQLLQTFGNRLEMGQNSRLRDQLLGLEGKVGPQGVIRIRRKIYTVRLAVAGILRAIDIIGGGEGQRGSHVKPAVGFVHSPDVDIE